MYVWKSSDVLQKSKSAVSRLYFPNLALKWTEQEEVYFVLNMGMSLVQDFVIS